jgi:predicted permease
VNPPRLARWLLARTLPPADRAVILGDLAEEFQARRRAGVGASAWYWRQALGTLPAAAWRRLPSIESSISDIRFTLRMWRRQPAFAAAAISTQAIGIAVTTAVLAVAYAVLVQPLPYAEPGRLVHLFEGTGRSGQFSFQDFLDVRRANRAFEGVAGHSGGSRTLTTPGSAPERLPMAEVTDGFLEVFGVAPILGRTFHASDVRRGAPPVVILSHPTWARRFGADTGVVGKSVALGGVPHEIIGVLPRSFAFPSRGQPELWLPLRPSVQQEQRGYMHWMGAIARPRPGLSDAQIRADLGSVAQVIAARDQQNHSSVTLRSIPLRDMIVAPVRPTINALLAGVVLVVLVTCATTAALLLSRAAPRRRELSVRSALGASRGRIVRQLLTENVLLSLTGGALGILAGHWLVRLFVEGMPAQQKAVLPHFDNPGVGIVVASAAMAVSVATGLLFGVAPAWRASRLDDRDTLKTVRVTAGAAEMRLRSSLVALQVAIALILLSGAGLLATSVHRLLNVPVGFDPNGVLTMRLNLPPTPKYATAEAVRAFQRQLLDELNAAPGIMSAALINQGPLMGSGNNGDLHVRGRPSPPDARRPIVAIRTISAGYFSTMRVPLVSGRWFGSTDRAGSPQVVIVNRLLAETVFAGADPIGEGVSFQFLPGEWQIVGIVENERFDDIDRPLLPALYFAAEQGSTGSFMIALRSSDTGGAAATARRVVSGLDPDLPVFGVRTLDMMAAESSAVFLRRATLWMLGIFAAASVVLAAMGLYGVLAQSVADRTREIGVRVALGASRGNVVRLVMRRALAAAGTGAAVGVLGTLAASKWLSSLLFGVSPRDPLTIAVATLFLAGVALVACLIPTRRALNIDPAAAVRE